MPDENPSIASSLVLPHLVPKWHIVVPTRNADGASEGFWSDLESLAQSRRDIAVTVIDSHDQDSDFTAYAAIVGRTGFRYLHLPCNDAVQGMRFNWPLACTVGAALSSAPYILLLHDDVSLPDDMSLPDGDGGWLDALESALDSPGVGLAVPMLSGDTGSPMQGLELPVDIPWVDTAEYVSSAALAIRRDLLTAFPLDTAMTGYDWAQVLLQWQLADAGMKTVVVPAARLSHIGGGTYDRMAIDDLMLANCALYCKRAGGQAFEHRARPSRPRVAPRISMSSPSGDVIDPVSSLCFVVDGDAGIDALLRLITTEGHLDVAVVDVNPSALHAARIRQFAVDQAGKGVRSALSVRYLPFWDTDAVRQAIGSAYCEEVTVYDLRTGHASPPAAITGRRLRVGAHYDLPGRMEWLDVGMAKLVGLGDTIMLTPSLHAFRSAYPNCKVRVHHCWDAGLVLLGNPDVDDVRIVQPGESLPMTYFNAGLGAGSEMTVRQMFRNLGVAPKVPNQERGGPVPAEVFDDAAWESVDRRLRYHFLPGERETALRQMAEWAGEANAGLFADEKAVVVAVQLHGGWKSKRWANTETLIRQVVESGWYVLLVGNDEERILPLPEIDHVFRMGSASIREMIAAMHLCDICVGFDSGFIYAASAHKYEGRDGHIGQVGTPTASLWGPHNPKGLLGDTQPSNAVMLRVLTPDMCRKTHGTSCRETHGGAQCPLREGPGGDCLDAITPCSVYDEVVLAPKWGKALPDRW